MGSSIEIAKLTVNAGEKYQGSQFIEELGYGLPLTVINGVNPGKTVVITSGIHGCEYVGIQTAIELAGELSPREISGAVVIIHPVNVSGFIQTVPALLPEAGKNLNRLFPGNAGGCCGDKLAHRLTHDFIDKADFYLDLHGGDLFEELTPFVFYPGAADAAITEQSRQIAARLGVGFMLKSQAVSGAYNSAAIRGVPSLLVERGGGGRWSREEVSAYKKDVRTALAVLGVLPESEAERNASPVEVKDPVYLDADMNGCWYPEVSAGDKIEKNQLLGAIKDFFGETRREYRAEHSGVVLYINVFLSACEGKPLVAYAALA